MLNDRTLSQTMAEISGSQPGVVLFSRGPWAKSGDIFGYGYWHISG